jgi:hypothetical protein
MTIDVIGASSAAVEPVVDAIARTGNYPRRTRGQAQSSGNSECLFEMRVAPSATSAGARFECLATHVWRTHQIWADEYHAPATPATGSIDYFGLSARRGLVGTVTGAKLRAAATE